MKRRLVLIGLSTIPVAISGLVASSKAQAQAGDASDFLRISRTLTGNNNLSQEIADRIETKLKEKAIVYLTNPLI